MPSLFDPLAQAGLTTLRIQYDFRTDSFLLSAAREWTADTPDWSTYRRAFSWETNLTGDGRLLTHQEVLDLYAAAGLGAYLQQVCDLLRQGKHERVEGWLHPGRDIHFFNNVHSSVVGLDNGYHSIRSGGIRRHDPTERELDNIIDGLNLARGMSFKNIAAGIPFGGCKSVVVCPPVDLEDMETLGFIAYCIDRTRSFTGPDMGLSPALADAMNEKFSRNFGGGYKGNIGPSGAPTAYGNLLAIRAACEFLDGSPSLSGKTALVMGVGSVGAALARYLLADGADLIISDADPTAVEGFLVSLTAGERARVQAVRAEDTLAQQADIFAPCAVGGILDDTTIPGLRFRMILGSANNVLRASSQEEEIRLAELLKDAGILYQVEWAQSVGGVLSGIETYLHGAEASMEHVHRICEERVPAATRYNLETARDMDITPTQVAYETIEGRLYR